MAWSMNRGLYSALKDIVPVGLLDPTAVPSQIAVEQMSGSFGVAISGGFSLLTLLRRINILN